MSITNFNTSNQTFRKLLGNGLTYRVPKFQRDYSWTEQEWDDLWQDIIELTEPGGEQGHYMGYLVLQSGDERNFDIIDGQQRMTTLSLIVLAILKNLQTLIDQNIAPDENRKRAEELRKTYIGYLDPVTLVSKSKLTLNRHNEAFYQSYLVPLQKIPVRNLKVSEHLLRKGFYWFEEKIQRKFEKTPNGSDLALFLDMIADRLFFTVISVNDELNAFKVFETLNARGVRLSSTDLLKNYLFSIVHNEGSHENEISALEERWESILGRMGGESLPDFLRVFWNSQNTLTRHSELFKVIRGNLKDKHGVFKLLRDMDRDVDTYAAFNNENDPQWNSDQKRYIKELKIFNVKQPYSLLLSAKRVLEASEFTRILRAISIISFRYNIIGNMATHEQERIYNSIAEKIAKNGYSEASEIIRALKPVYLEDEHFQYEFKQKQIKTTTNRNKQVLRYILFEIERHISNRDYDYFSDKYTIEHILPENPDETWAEFPDGELDRYTYRIGNMTILEAKPNRNIGNKSFSEKRTVLQGAPFEITKMIASYSSWTSDSIIRRQEWLAKQANAIWRIGEF